MSRPRRPLADLLPVGFEKVARETGDGVPREKLPSPDRHPADPQYPNDPSLDLHIGPDPEPPSQDERYGGAPA